MPKSSFIHLTEVAFIALLGSFSPVYSQSTSVPLQSGTGSPWKTSNLADAIDQPSGKSLIAVKPGDASALWKSEQALSPERSGGSTSPLRSASALAGLAYQLEGFQGIPDDTSTDYADPSGAVSPDFVVTAQNNGIRIQDRKGKELKSVGLDTFFVSVGPFRTKLIAPRVIYDPNNKRFLVAASADLLSPTASIVLAVSKTADPRGEWKASRIGTPYTSTYFLQFHMAIAGKILAISGDLYAGLSYDSTQNYLFALNSLYLEGGSLTYQKFEDFLSGNVPASDPTPDTGRVLFVNNTYNLINGNYVLAFKDAVLQPNGASFNVSVRSYADAGDIYKYYPGEILPQPGTDKKINAADSIIANCVARGMSAWCVNTMFVRFGAELRSVIQYTKANWPTTGGAITLTERVRVDDSTGASYFAFPSIAVNKNGDLFIGYNRFRADKYASAFFAYRRSTDPAGGLFYDNLVKEGEDAYERGAVFTSFGSYSTSMVDPVDDTSFWTLQNYAASRTEGGTTTWGTWWTHFSQHNGVCSYKLDQATLDAPLAGGNFKVQLTPNFPDCAWMVAPNAAWLSQSNSPATVGPATLEFKASANKRGQARTGTIRVGDQLLTVRQPANPAPPQAEPNLTILRVDAPATGRVGETILVTVTLRNNGTKAAPRFRIGFYLGTGSTVTTADLSSGYACSVTNGLAIDATTTCTGSIPLDPKLNPGTYTLAAIADDTTEVPMTDRSGASRVSDGGLFVLKAAATAPSISAAAVVNGATAVAGPIAPGAILVLYGARLGPAALTTLALTPQGRVTTTLGGTRVLFDGVAAPMIYTSAGQLSVIAPYSLAGKTSTQVSIEYNAVRGDAVTVPVAAAAPGFFTVDFSGKNQVAALNEDGTVNSSANPLGSGKLIVLYGTGAGTFKTTPVDGAVIGAPLPEFVAPLSLKIGGLDAEILYAGPAPGLVSGVFQINARVPDALLPSDKVSIMVTSGAIDSPLGTTIAVK